jgi:hypothetical protein
LPTDYLRRRRTIIHRLENKPIHLNAKHHAWRKSLYTRWLCEVERVVLRKGEWLPRSFTLGALLSIPATSPPDIDLGDSDKPICSPKSGSDKLLGEYSLLFAPRV